MPHPKSATAWPPSCAAPRETIQAPSFVLPTGACDTHAHVICADFERYPLVPERSYTPPPAPEALYLDMLRATGMQRGVLVQPMAPPGHEVILGVKRDATLAMPTLILPAVQVNIRAGALPEPEGNGVRYLKLPIDAL